MDMGVFLGVVQIVSNVPLHQPVKRRKVIADRVGVQGMIAAFRGQADQKSQDRDLHGLAEQRLKADQEQTLIRLTDAARRQGLELLVEVIPSKVAPIADDTTAQVIQRLYEIGIQIGFDPLLNLRSDVQICKEKREKIAGSLVNVSI